jgi:hypothetical protein
LHDLQKKSDPYKILTLKYFFIIKNELSGDLVRDQSEFSQARVFLLISLLKYAGLLDKDLT